MPGLRNPVSASLHIIGKGGGLYYRTLDDAICGSKHFIF